MNLTRTSHTTQTEGQPPPSPSVLNAWAMALMGASFILAAAFMATYFSRFAVQSMGVEAARIMTGRLVIGGAVCALVVGAGAMVLLVMANQHRKAIAFACWLALGINVVAGAAFFELGMEIKDAPYQAILTVLATAIYPAICYGMMVVTREGLVRPIFRLVDFLGGVLNAIAASCPWGPLWGKALAVLFAVCLVAATAATLLRVGIPG